MSEIKKIKTRAKIRRNREKYQGAIDILSPLVEKIEEEIHNSTSSMLFWYKELYAEVADICGIQGGIFRRMGLKPDAEKSEEENEENRVTYLVKSVEAYDKGYHYEFNEEYGSKKSYNLVNRLVSRIMLEPQRLQENSAAESAYLENDLDVYDALKDAEEKIKDKKDDIWALADLGLLRLLQGKDPEKALAGFFENLPPDHAYKSFISTLKPLSNLDLEEAIKANLEKAIALLRKENPQLDKI